MYPGRGWTGHSLPCWCGRVGGTQCGVSPVDWRRDGGVEGLGWWWWGGAGASTPRPLGLVCLPVCLCVRPPPERKPHLPAPSSRPPLSSSPRRSAPLRSAVLGSVPLASLGVGASCVTTTKKKKRKSAESLFLEGGMDPRFLR